jgi:BlaI family transcriptional regulator, penicillinase repressor
MRSRKPTLTDQELEIMKVVWELRQCTVRDVYETLLKRRRIAYTTVMTMMKILDGKGFPERSRRRIGRMSTSLRSRSRA